MKKKHQTMEAKSMEHVTLEFPTLSEGIETAKVINGKKYVFKLIAISNMPKNNQSSDKEVSSTKKSQKEVIESLYGAWPIDETADELITRVKSTRKSSEILQMEE